MEDQQGIFRLIGNGFLIWSALVGTASVIMHLRVPWWRSEMGRHLMAYMAVFGVVLDLGVVRLIVGDSWGFQLLRLAVFVGVPIVMSQRLYLQFKAQRVVREDAAADPPAASDAPGPAGGSHSA